MIPDTITIVSSRWVTSWFRHLVYQHPVILVTGRVYCGVGLPRPHIQYITTYVHELEENVCLQSYFNLSTFFTPAVCPSHVRVSIDAKKGGSFNRTPTDKRDKVSRFEQLLTGPVGDGLCRMYARYWQPASMARYLEEAALYSKDHKSTVSITDSVSNENNCISLMRYSTVHTVRIRYIPYFTLIFHHSNCSSPEPKCSYDPSYDVMVAVYIWPNHLSFSSTL